MLRFKYLLKLTVFFAVLCMFSACEQTKMQKNKVRIAIQPLGNVQQSRLKWIQQSLSELYDAQVFILPERAMYPQAFVQLKSPRYRADTLLRCLKKDMPDSADFIIGVTMKDISTTKYEIYPIKIKSPEHLYKDWGVFGLGACPGKSCVVSLFRIGKNEKLIQERLKKIAVHEVGHNLGLKHCEDKNCVMTDAVERISSVDNAKLQLCNKCLQIIDN